MTLRKTLFWTHLVVGISAGLVILSMCVTGIILAFEPQIVDFVERRSGKAPTGEVLATQFYEIKYDFVLQKAAQALAAAE